MYLLFPGRHHLLTQFQFDYVKKLIAQDDTIEGVIFAVTSSNHSGTKRNPIPFYLRAMMIQEFCKELPISNFVYGIDDVGVLENFATYTLKQIKHQSDGKLDLTPENCQVICSTPVLRMYQKLGFTIKTAELDSIENQTFSTELPWDLVEQIVANEQWQQSADLQQKIHTSTQKIWNTYGLGDRVRNILNDPIITEDGDLTESRDYTSYVRQMDEIAELKYKDTAPYIEPGIIGDIGCAVGSWIKQASDDPKLQESDFYGIELARQLFDICNQRKVNGEFGNPNVFFAQKNAVSSLVFEKGTMSTIHTSSLTHEIESYGSRDNLLQFIENRFEELHFGGVWINRDVIGPDNGDRIVLMELNASDGSDEDIFKEVADQQELGKHLDGLSTMARFLRFAQDFRQQEGDGIQFETIKRNNKEYIKLPLRDAAEFMLTKDYTDNWYSEMHERFCFWGFNDWKTALEKVGFQLDRSSHAYSNPWIVQNRFENKAALFTEDLEPLRHPPTNALIIARKV